LLTTITPVLLPQQAPVSSLTLAQGEFFALHSLCATSKVGLLNGFLVAKIKVGGFGYDIS